MCRRDYIYAIYLLCFSLWARSLAASELSFHSLKELIEKKKVSSIEQLLPFLPESYRSKYVLMFSSRSLQESSYKEPRILLYGKDAKFIITFNGNPSQKGFDALETMEFDENLKQFNFREITFPVSGKKPLGVTFSNENPEKCQKCHGNPTRPVWDSHPFWPGAYGEHYHEPLSDSEKAGIEAFLSHADSNGRYKHLRDRSLFADKETFYPSPQSRYNGIEKDSPNEELTQLLSGMNLASIVNNISLSKNFKYFSYAMLGSLFKDCASLNELFPENSRKDLRKKFGRFINYSRTQNRDQIKIKMQRSDLIHEQPNSSLEKSLESLDNLRFIAEYGLGISTDQWSMALEKQTYDFTTFRWSGPEIESLLIPEMSKFDGQIKSLYSTSKMGLSEKYCNYLRKESLANLTQLQSEMAEAFLANPPWVDVGVVNDINRPQILKECIGCHEGGVGPFIPFSDPDKMSQVLNDGNYPRGHLIDEIKFRISPEAGKDKMPIDINLSDEERKVLMDYFTGMVGSGLDSSFLESL